MWPHYTRQISSPHHSINIQLQVVYTTSTNDWCPRIWNPFRIDHPFPINFFTWKKERKIKLYNLYGYQKWGRKHCYCNKWIWYCTQWKFTHKKSIKEREYLWIATSSLNANYICHQNNNNRFFFFGKGRKKEKETKPLGSPVLSLSINMGTWPRISLLSLPSCLFIFLYIETIHFTIHHQNNRSYPLFPKQDTIKSKVNIDIYYYFIKHPTKDIEPVGEMGKKWRERILFSLLMGML